MEIHIAENIRRFRKDRRLTQEQLAEAFGVSVAAVSKWESGQSVPDISLIVELAAFFETSVDVLLGYNWGAGSMGRAVERLKTLRREKRYAEGEKAAEQALLKYPNSFEVVFYSAQLFSVIGLELGRQEASRQALALFQRSLELLDQNQDPRIGRFSIENDIANAYIVLGNTEEALAYLKSHNYAGIHSDMIGLVLSAQLRQPEEALPYLSEAMADHLTGLVRTVIGFSNAYGDLKKYGDAIEILSWQEQILLGLKRPGVVSFWDKLLSILNVGKAFYYRLSGDTDGAKGCLRQARALALAFDAAPDYHFKNVRFYRCSEDTTVYDDMGQTAMEAIVKTIHESEDNQEALLSLWEEICHEES